MLRIYCFASCWILHFMHCIMLTLAHIQPFYALDQVHTDPVSKVQVEQAQVEEITNLVWIKAIPDVFNHAVYLTMLLVF
jgi:PIN domain nuclease of toxin-antitoxin system